MSVARRVEGIEPTIRVRVRVRDEVRVRVGKSGEVIVNGGEEAAIGGVLGGHNYNYIYINLAANWRDLSLIS